MLRHTGEYINAVKMGYCDILYVTIHSQDSMDYFPDNIASDFVVRLPYKLELNGRWNVGVNQIWLTKHWFNISNAWIQISVNGSEFEEYYLTSGCYDDNLTLLRELNLLIERVSKDAAHFTLNHLNDRVTIDVADGVMIKLSRNICTLIGWDFDTVISSSWTSEKSMDINADYRMIMVCADFISEQLFGDKVAKVVKILDCSSQYYGEMVHDNVLTDNAMICKDMIDTMHIQLKDRSGRVLKCIAGSCAIQLRLTRDT